jgi:COMPASS component SWD2
MHPGNDDFISCSKDNTIRLWNFQTKNAVGLLHLNNPYLAAFDPSGQIFAVGSPLSGEVLLYDHKKFDKAPISTFDIVESCWSSDPYYCKEGWTKLEFSNDGRCILIGTKGNGHFLLDAFSGKLRAFLKKPRIVPTRLAAGEESIANGSTVPELATIEGSGDVCFSQDGRYVVGGFDNSLLVWDVLATVDENKVLEPLHVLEDDSSRQAAVVAWNPRFNFIASANQEVVFWVPDPHA